MAGKYKTYQKYKDTDDLWCQRVPSHWSIERLRNLGKFSASGIDKKTAIGEPLVKIVNYTDVYNNKSNVLNSDQDYMVVSCDSEKKKVHQIYKGDLLFTPSSETVEDIGVSCLVDEDMVDTSFSYHLIRLQFFHNIFHGYRKYLVNNDFVLNQLSKKARGTTRQTLGRDDFKSILVFLPLYEEQEQIASFLDNETAKIDTLIEKQQQLIKLLKEKRQALISHAVTKGLNPDVPMRDSGIEWLGEVPDHWRVISLKHLVSAPIIDGPHLTPTKLDTGIPFISAEAISQGYINFDKKWGYISRADHEIYSKRYSPKKDDILMVKLGATTGVVAMVDTDEDFNVWVPLATIRPKEDISSKFIFYLLQSTSVRDAIQLSWTYGTQQTLGLGTLANISLPVPPENESYQIVKLIELKVPVYDESVKKCEVSLQYLKERRTALISAAVTGKIDVRHWQSPAAAISQGVIND
jgi:type I restriction enzyme S subunit